MGDRSVRKSPSLRGSPARSVGTGNPLYKSVLQKSANNDPASTSRSINSSKLMDNSANLTRSRGQADSVFKDISNVQGNDSFANIDFKKISALAAYKKFTAEVTPRTAVNNFIQSEEDAVTPAVYFNSQRSTQQRINLSKGSSYNQGRSIINASTVISDISMSSVSSGSSRGSPEPLTRSARKSRSRSKINPMDLDPDRDITKPTNLTGIDETRDISFDIDNTMLPPRRIPRKKRKAKDHLDNLDFSVEAPHVSGMVATPTILQEETPSPVIRKTKRVKTKARQTNEFDDIDFDETDAKTRSRVGGGGMETLLNQTSPRVRVKRLRVGAPRSDDPLFDDIDVATPQQQQRKETPTDQRRRAVGAAESDDENVDDPEPEIVRHLTPSQQRKKLSQSRAKESLAVSNRTEVNLEPEVDSVLEDPTPELRARRRKKAADVDNMFSEIVTPDISIVSQSSSVSNKQVSRREEELMNTSRSSTSKEKTKKFTLSLSLTSSSSRGRDDLEESGRQLKASRLVQNASKATEKSLLMNGSGLSTPNANKSTAEVNDRTLTDVSPRSEAQRPRKKKNKAESEGFSDIDISTEDQEIQDNSVVTGNRSKQDLESQSETLEVSNPGRRRRGAKKAREIEADLSNLSYNNFPKPASQTFPSFLDDTAESNAAKENDTIVNEDQDKTITNAGSAHDSVQSQSFDTKVLKSSQRQTPKEKLKNVIEFSPIINTPSPSSRLEVQNLKERTQDVSKRTERLEENHEDIVDDDDAEKFAQLEETKARRAARKSTVLGYLTRAPNLSNIAETSEMQSRVDPSKLSRGPNSLENTRRSKDSPNVEQGGGLRESRRLVEQSRAESSRLAEQSRAESSRLAEQPRTTEHSQQQGIKAPIPDNPLSEEEEVEEATAAGKTLRVNQSGSTETVEAEKNTAAGKGLKRDSRKSVYEAGLPDLPGELENTKSFSPYIESTRIGNLTGLPDISPVEPIKNRELLRLTTPGVEQISSRVNTSTPDMEKEASKAGRSSVRQEQEQRERSTKEQTQLELTATNRNKSNTSGRNVGPPESSMNHDKEREEEDPEAISSLNVEYVDRQRAFLSKSTLPEQMKQPQISSNKSLNPSLLKAVLSHGTGFNQDAQTLTPELIRRAKRLSSMGVSPHRSLYQTRVQMEMIAEGGTQTTPTLSVLQETDVIIENILRKNMNKMSTTASVQVTPGLHSMWIQQTLRSAANSPVAVPTMDITNKASAQSPVNASSVNKSSRRSPVTRSMMNSVLSNKSAHADVSSSKSALIPSDGDLLQSRTTRESTDLTNRSGSLVQSRPDAQITSMDGSAGNQALGTPQHSLQISDMESLVLLTEDEVQVFKDQFKKLDEQEKECIHRLEQSADGQTSGTDSTAREETDTPSRKKIKMEILLIKEQKDMIQDIIANKKLPMSGTSTPVVNSASSPSNSHPGHVTNQIHQQSSVDLQNKVSPSQFDSAASSEVSSIASGYIPVAPEFGNTDPPLQQASLTQNDVDPMLSSAGLNAEEVSLYPERLQSSRKDNLIAYIDAEDNEITLNLTRDRTMQTKGDTKETEIIEENLDFDGESLISGYRGEIPLSNSGIKLAPGQMLQNGEDLDDIELSLVGEDDDALEADEQPNELDLIKEFLDSQSAQDNEAVVNVPVTEDINNIEGQSSNAAVKGKKQLRQATLERYFGPSTAGVMNDLTWLETPTASRSAGAAAPRTASRRAAKPVKPTVFPKSFVKFQFQRHCRYKLPKACEEDLMAGSEQFNKLFLARCTELAKERGDKVIRLSDMRQAIGETGWVKSAAEDPDNRWFFEEIYADGDPKFHALIPKIYGGVCVPPKDIWEPKIIRKRSRSRKSVKSNSASSVARLEVSRDLYANRTREMETEDVELQTPPTKQKSPRSSKPKKKSSKKPAAASNESNDEDESSTRPKDVNKKVNQFSNKAKSMRGRRKSKRVSK